MSAIERDKCRFFSVPRTFRFSTQIVSNLAELRVAGATGKEVLEGFPQLNDRPLRRTLGDL